MLVELSISDFAIIDELRLSFDKGLTALTGETGAGKSIIIDALGAVLGERVSSDLVRTGAKAARVEAIFDLIGESARPLVRETLDEIGVEPDGEPLIVSREIGANGRSTARVNGRAVPVTVLHRIGAQLVDIHGQSDHLSLLRPAVHLEALDRFAGLGELRAQVGERARRLRELRRRIAAIESGSREREQRVDLLSFQINEIAIGDLSVGEDERLEAERLVLSSAERITADLARAMAALESEDETAALPALRVAETAVRAVSAVDANAGELAERASELLILAQELFSDLLRHSELVAANPKRLEEIDERLDLIRRLKRKYGETIEEVLAFAETAQRELESLTGGEVDTERLREDEDRLVGELTSAAVELSVARRAAASRLSAAVEASIAELNMGRAKFAVRIEHRPSSDGIEVDGQRVAYDETGIDEVEFLLAPNAGESLKPLARIASGGEMARLMLALTSVLATGDSTPTLVFDEVDVGVGARSGQVVGEKLWGLTEGHQVLVITHLAQIAAFSDTHYKINKAERSGRTVSQVDELEAEERVEEIAAMLDGVPVTPQSTANAAQLLERVLAWKRTCGVTATA